MDSRIRTLVENSVKLRQRSMFVIVGDKGRDQVQGGAEGRARTPYGCLWQPLAGLPAIVCLAEQCNRAPARRDWAAAAAAAL